MLFDKEQIIDFLKSLGKNDEAARADSELPDKVDTDKDRGLLEKFGVDPKEVLGRLGRSFGL
ncbi:hypothetical protein ABIB15_000077 [Marisediminicola sp. UYEF4]|uniref:hypothetical protein n=1 Tax=Marisediminicola sp. UYEF4 TaxID=1756384 RepID=UPI003391D83F